MCSSGPVLEETAGQKAPGIHQGKFFSGLYLIPLPACTVGHNLCQWPCYLHVKYQRSSGLQIWVSQCGFCIRLNPKKSLTEAGVYTMARTVAPGKKIGKGQSTENGCWLQ